MDASVIVVGAGPAGLAVGACLRSYGIEPLIVDRGSAVGESWRLRYDRLHLHTPRVQSGLPGLPIPRSYGRWVSRDDMADYLRAYADHHGLRPVFATEVRGVERAADGWRLDTTRGALRAPRVVLACGYNREPVIPAWPGAHSFGPRLFHASAYRDAVPFRGRSVLVVGSGNTGAEVAADLAEQGAAQVHLAIRTPPNIVPRQIGLLPSTLLAVPQDYLPAWLLDPGNRALQRVVLGDLSRYGMPAPQRGVVAQMRATGVTPTIDVGLVDQLRAGRVIPVAAVSRFEGDEVVLADGSRLEPDAVIAATGYSPALAPLIGRLGVLDPRGRPRARGRAAEPAAPGMYFVGLSNPLKGLLLQISIDARAAAAAIARGERRLPTRPRRPRPPAWSQRRRRARMR